MRPAREHGRRPGVGKTSGDRSEKEHGIDERHAANKAKSGSKSKPKEWKGGDAVQQAQEWGGGSKASKGPMTPADRRNPNSSSKT